MSNELTAIESEIEDTRERLAGTIDQLLHRANPKTIASRQVTALRNHYVDQRTGEPRTDNILKTVGAVVGTVALFVLVRRVAS